LEHFGFVEDCVDDSPQRFPSSQNPPRKSARIPRGRPLRRPTHNESPTRTESPTCTESPTRSESTTRNQSLIRDQDLTPSGPSRRRSHPRGANRNPRRCRTTAIYALT
jgi:hypothetical protein